MALLSRLKAVFSFCVLLLCSFAFMIISPASLIFTNALSSLCFSCTSGLRRVILMRRSIAVLFLLTFCPPLFEPGLMGFMVMSLFRTWDKCL